MTFEKVKKLIVETLSVDEDKIKLESNLAEDLKIDSLDAVELVMTLEEEFDIKLPDDVLKQLKTVEDVVKCVDQYKA